MTPTATTRQAPAGGHRRSLRTSPASSLTKRPGGGGPPPPPASRARTWPALPARPRAGPWPRRRPATLLAALVLLGAASGGGIAAISQGQTVRFTPADNPAATSQYTPSAGPVTQPPATASPSPGPPTPSATMSPSPAPASDPPAISQAGAAKVLAAFWAANNQANQA